MYHISSGRSGNSDIAAPALFLAPAPAPAPAPPALIDIVCARCSHPFYTALDKYVIGTPPSAPPSVSHAHTLMRTERSSTLYGGCGAFCNGCGKSIGDSPSFGCARCSFDLCDSCARPPPQVHIAACLRTSANPLAGSLRAGPRAATWNCAACARPPSSNASWTVDGGTGAISMQGAGLAIAIGQSEARILAHTPTLPPQATPSAAILAPGPAQAARAAAGGGAAVPGAQQPLYTATALPQAFDIGVFVAQGEADSSGEPVTCAPGAGLLRAPQLPALLPPPPPAAIAALAAAVLAPTARPPRGEVHVGASEALPPAACQALIAAVEASWAAAAAGLRGAAEDAAFTRELPRRSAPARAVAASIAAGSKASDFKLLLGSATVGRVLGRAGQAAVLGALEAVRGREGAGAPLALRDVVFAVRRTEAQAGAPRWINFHCDSAGATAQVPLGGPQRCMGGRTVFALPTGELLVPERAAGRVVAHNGDVAHGVTLHREGVRYGLFALVARAL